MRMRRLQLDPGLGAGLGGVLAIVVAATLTGFRSEIPQVSVALILVLTVLVGALVGGRIGGAATALVAALCFDFFHTRPYNSLSIEKREDVQAAVLLLVVGLVIGGLARRHSASENEAEAGRSDVRRLHRAAELVASGAEESTVIAAVESELRELLHLRHCTYEQPPGPDPYPHLERSGVLLTDVHHFTGAGLQLPAGGFAIDVLARGRPAGRFVLYPEPDSGASLEDRIVAVALVDQVGSALTGAGRP